MNPQPLPKQTIARRRNYFGSIRQQLRHTFFVRGELRCAVCGVQDDLELHHIIPIKMGGLSDIDNLMPPCHAHHVQIHHGNAAD